MAVILSIETSNQPCSVALTAEGMVLRHRENFDDRNHAALLSGYIKEMLDFCAEKEIKPEAVAVSMGPGSYTGLRIGLSEAKGLAYGLDIPMIGINTLELMTTHVMFNYECDSEDTLFVPMIDARRMEVYTAVYDMSLREVVKPRPVILDGDDNCLNELLNLSGPVLFFGNGMEKWREYLGDCVAANIRFIDNVVPLAVDMTALAERAYHRKEFIDTAYSTPYYLKDFQATRPRNKVLGDNAVKTGQEIQKN